MEPIQLEFKLEEKMPGKFPVLQEELRAHLTTTYARCLEATRAIKKASEERAEMYEKMADEVKTELGKDRDYFNALEG